MRTTHLLGLALLLAPIPLHAQQAACARNYGSTVLEECDKMEDAQWESELERLNTVPMGDSLYERTLLLKCSILLGHERWDEDLAACEEGIRLGGSLEHYFHLDKGTVLNSMGRYEESMAYFDQCQKRYPGSFIFYYMKALAAKDHKDYAHALELAEATVRRFPLDPRGHALLAELARDEGQTARAAMALSMALIVSWGGAGDEQRLGDLDRILSGGYDTDSKGLELGKDDDFSEVDLLLKNRVAMEKKYKVKPDLTYPMCRQSHLLFTWLAKNQPGTGFWSEFYVPLFQRLMQEDLFEGFVYHCLSSSRSDKVNAIARKKSGDVQHFRERSDRIVHELYRVYPDSAGAPPVDHWYYRDGGFLASGPYDIAADKFTGPLTNYHPSGAIASHGELGADNKRSGPWTDWFSNGVVATQADYRNGNGEGRVISYYRNGAMNDSAQVIGGKLQGSHHHHDFMGALRELKTFKDDKIEGPATELHACGTVASTYSARNGLMDGPTATFFPDGRKEFEGAYANGELSGTQTTWFHNGTKRNEFNFSHGKPDGPYKEWYMNGQLKNEGTKTNGVPSGPYKMYNADGKPDQEGQYDENGRATGVVKYYNEDGTLYHDEEYQHDLLVRYHYYDRAGKVIAEGERKKGKFQYEGVYPDGTKYVSGVYLDEGLKDGKWAYYWADGSLRSEENMVKGKPNGLQRNYDQAGKQRVDWNYTEPDRTGTYTEYYVSGKTHRVGWLVQGKLNGTYREYLPDGTLVSDEYYVDGDLSGWQRYFDQHGKPSRTERVVDGSLRERMIYDADGKEYQHYVVGPGAFTAHELDANGKPALDIPMTCGETNGQVIYYYPNGVVSKMGRYVNGQVDGSWVSRHPNGKKSVVTHWDLGVHVGTDSTWYPTGTLRSIEQYANDQTNGLYRLYDRNGTMVIERQRLNGEEHGVTRAWTPEGDLQLFRYYDHDVLVAYASPKADHTAGDSIPLPLGKQDMMPKFPNGHAAREMHMRNGEIDGIYKEFYAGGGLLEQTPYSTGTINGTSVEYYPDGKLKESTEYVDGLANGPYVLNGPNGKPLEEGTYVYGELDGDYKVYTSNGTLQATYVYRSGNIIAIK